MSLMDAKDFTSASLNHTSHTFFQYFKSRFKTSGFLPLPFSKNATSANKRPQQSRKANIREVSQILKMSLAGWFMAMKIVSDWTKDSGDFYVT